MLLLVSYILRLIRVEIVMETSVLLKREDTNLLIFVGSCITQGIEACMYVCMYV